MSPLFLPVLLTCTLTIASAVLFLCTSSATNYSATQTLSRPPSHQNHDVETSSLLVFSHTPHDFLERLSSCILNGDCRVLYHHVQKSGGSHLASKLYELVGDAPYRSQDWCCFDKFMQEKFDPQTYCQYKVGVYEVSPSQFAQVVQTCHKTYPDTTYLSLVTIREPIQRTLSMIHHQCNKNFDYKDEAERAICRECQYTPDNHEYWDWYVQQTNQLYQDLVHFAVASSLLLDSTMMTLMLHDLAVVLNQTVPSVGRTNQERTPVCNFGVVSKMMKNLYPAHLAYQRLLLGQVR